MIRIINACLTTKSALGMSGKILSCSIGEMLNELATNVRAFALFGDRL